MSAHFHVHLTQASMGVPFPSVDQYPLESLRFMDALLIFRVDQGVHLLLHPMANAMDTHFAYPLNLENRLSDIHCQLQCYGAYGA